MNNDSSKKMSLEEATIKSLYDELEDTRIKNGVEGIVDDVLVVTDPEINSDEYDELIQRASEIIEDTPEGDIPLDDTYLGQYAQLCPICGSTFIEDHILEPGTACPICLETPEAFVMVGQLASEEDVAEDNGIEVEDEETDEEIIPEVEEGAGEDEELRIEASEEVKTSDTKLVEEYIPNHNGLRCPRCGNAEYVEVDDEEDEDGTQHFHYECQNCKYTSEKDEYSLNETTNKGIQAKKQDLYARTRQLLKDKGDPNWQNLMGLKGRLSDEELEAYEKEYAEFRAIEMIHSILTYSPRALWTVDHVMDDKYLQSYIKELGMDKVKELVQQEIDEYVNNATIEQDVYTDNEGVTYNTVSFKGEAKDVLEERLDFKKYGIQRAPQYDFSDDGNRFTGYICNGVPISYLRDPEYGIYLTIRVDYLDGLTYNEYSTLPSYKDCNKYNGGLEESAVDLADVAEICKRIKQEYEDAVAEVKEVSDDDYKAYSDKYLEKAKKEYEDAKAAIRSLAPEDLLNASEWSIKEIKGDLEHIKGEIDRWSWERKSKTNQISRRRDLGYDSEDHFNQVSYWLKDLQKRINEIISKRTESLHENKEADIRAIMEIVNEDKEIKEEAIEDYADKLSVKFMARIFNQMRANGWDGKEETADKYFDEIMDKVVGKEEQGVELGESKKLDEERYYYGEIVYVQNALKSIKGSLGQAQSRLAKAMSDSAENEYSNEQIEVLKNVDTNIGNLIVDVDKVNEKLEKTFPTRIRIMTPEEKAEIERRVSAGELNESVEVSEVQEIHEAIENAEDMDEIQDIIYSISDNELENQVQLAYDECVKDGDDLDATKDFVLVTLEDNAEYAE